MKEQSLSPLSSIVLWPKASCDFCGRPCFRVNPELAALIISKPWLQTKAKPSKPPDRLCAWQRLRDRQFHSPVPTLDFFREFWKPNGSSDLIVYRRNCANLDETHFATLCKNLLRQRQVFYMRWKSEHHVARRPLPNIFSKHPKDVSWKALFS